MDHGWIVTVADPDQPGCQVSLMTHDATASVIPDVSIQVDDVDAVYAAALEAEAEIVHPLTDEPWEVRRFFVRDPDGHVLNVLSHKPAGSATSRDVGTLHGGRVRLRPAARDDIPALAAIRRTPEVHARWRGGEDLIAAVTEDFDEPDSTPYVIELCLLYTSPSPRDRS